MNTLTKLALGLIGQLKPLPPVGDTTPLRALLPPSLSGGMPLMSALSRRRSLREFAPEPLPEQVLSDLLWAAGGINRHDVDGRIAPSAMNAQEVYLYCASEGLATVIRAWFNRDALASAMGLQADHQLLLSQTVGAIKPAQAG